MSAQARLGRTPGAPCRPGPPATPRPRASRANACLCAALGTERVVNPAQETAANDFKLAPQPDESGDSNCTTIMHTNKMPPNGDNGVTNSGPLNEMPHPAINLHIASNASPIEMSAIRIIESDEAVLAGALARIAAREGSIVVYATRQLEPSRRDTAGR